MSQENALLQALLKNGGSGPGSSILYSPDDADRDFGAEAAPLLPKTKSWGQKFDSLFSEPNKAAKIKAARWLVYIAAFLGMAAIIVAALLYRFNVLSTGYAQLLAFGGVTSLGILALLAMYVALQPPSTIGAKWRETGRARYVAAIAITLGVVAIAMRVYLSDSFPNLATEFANIAGFSVNLASIGAILAASVFVMHVIHVLLQKPSIGFEKKWQKLSSAERVAGPFAILFSLAVMVFAKFYPAEGLFSFLADNAFLGQTVGNVIAGAAAAIFTISIIAHLARIFAQETEDDALSLEYENVVKLSSLDEGLAQSNKLKQAQDMREKKRREQHEENEAADQRRLTGHGFVAASSTPSPAPAPVTNIAALNAELQKAKESLAAEEKNVQGAMDRLSAHTVDMHKNPGLSNPTAEEIQKLKTQPLPVHLLHGEKDLPALVRRESKASDAVGVRMELEGDVRRMQGRFNYAQEALKIAQRNLAEAQKNLAAAQLATAEPPRSPLGSSDLAGTGAALASTMAASGIITGGSSANAATGTATVGVVPPALPLDPSAASVTTGM